MINIHVVGNDVNVQRNNCKMNEALHCAATQGKECL